MARTENLLTAKEVQAALRNGEKTRLSDGGGLFFEVSEKNKGVWYIRGRLNGVQKRRVLGHQDLTLAEARTLKNDEKKALKAGVDSVAEKRAVRKKSEEEGRTFAKITDEWLGSWKVDKDDRTVSSTIGRINKHILPTLGAMPYRSLTFADLKDVCNKIKDAGHREMANRVSTIINQICTFAKISGYHQYNIAEDLQSLFPKPKRDLNFEGFPAITDRQGVAEMLQKIKKFVDKDLCSPYMGAALMLFPLIPLRASSMLLAQWEHIDMDNRIWRIPPENMKGEIGQRKEFVIPLSRQAMEILIHLAEYRRNKFLFPSGGKQGHLTSEGVNNCLHRAGIPKGKMCVHGWRKVWGSLAREYGLPDKLVERGLAHASGSAVEQAYNKAEYKEIMRLVFQWWADLLSALADNTELPKLDLSPDLIYS